MFDIIYYIEKIIASTCSFCKIATTYYTNNRIVYRYICRKFGNHTQKYSVKPSSAYAESNYIWVIWWQGEETMPTLPQKCLNSIKANKADFHLIVIDQYNYSKYIEIPEIILRKFNLGNISIACFSDFLRFALLWKYGGWYFDATIYVTPPIPVPKGIYTIKHKYDQRFISKGLWSSFLWYVPPKYPLCTFVIEVMESYWNTHDKIINYFLIDHIIKVFYDYVIQFKNEIDSLEINCPNVYFFQNIESERKYNALVWEQLKANNLFFKCDRRRKSKLKNSFLSEILGV